MIQRTAFSIIMLFSFVASLHAARPLIGDTGLSGTGPRAAAVASLTETHLDNIIGTTGVFEQVTTRVLKEQLSRFDCREDTCVLRFARTAGIGVIIRGSVEDRGDDVELTLYAHGIDAPFFGGEIARYRVRIPVRRMVLSTREYSYICEEHAARFVSRLLRGYLTPVALTARGEIPAERWPGRLDGTFTVYRYDQYTPAGAPLRAYHAVGMVSFHDRIAAAAGDRPYSVSEGDFILVSSRDKADSLDEFYRGRKREIVLGEESVSDTISLLLLTAPASIMMPVASPFFGYYAGGDYRGLGLWAVNAAPYLYLEFTGLWNRPSRLESRHETVTRDDEARYYFALYFALAGGMSLFVDAFSRNSLLMAANYQGVQPLIGNSYTAAYLSLVCGGGGHFYRGARGWGYFYFHVDNILLYYTIRSFCRESRYNETTGEYERGERNTRRGYMALGALAAVKIVEIVHALVIDDRIENGEMVEERYSFSPAVIPESERGGIIFGAQCALRF